MKGYIKDKTILKLAKKQREAQREKEKRERQLFLIVQSARNDLEGIKLSIPKGIYCYDGDKLCPFWEMITIKDEDTNEEVEAGYCYYLELTDQVLLWDQCKVCGINEDWHEDELR